MSVLKVRNVVLLAVAGVGLSACSGYYGDGLYTGVSVGSGYNSGYYGYDDGYYGNSAYGAYGDPYWGWYGDYYYPGTGYYVYDQNRRAYRWDNYQQRYWSQRRQSWRGNYQNQGNWGDFDRHGQRGYGNGYQGRGNQNRGDRRHNERGEDHNGNEGRGHDRREDRRGDRGGQHDRGDRSGAIMNDIGAEAEARARAQAEAAANAGRSNEDYARAVQRNAENTAARAEQVMSRGERQRRNRRNQQPE